jgi:hypothetical protein
MSAEQLDLHQLLSESEVALGCFEILWRLTPVRALVVPPFLSSFCGLHCSKDWAAEAPEGHAMVAKLQAYAARAELLLMPILRNGHWTLLALHRASAGSSLSAQSETDKEKEVSEETVGCAKCDWRRGCLECDARKAAAYVTRVGKERCCFFPTAALTPLPACEWWDCRYYDSLDVPSLECARMAFGLIDALQPLNARNTRSPNELAATRVNKLYQGATSQCGWYCLHFVEEEIRRYRGEGTHSFYLDKFARVHLLRTFGKKMEHPGCQ